MDTAKLVRLVGTLIVAGLMLWLILSMPKAFGAPVVTLTASPTSGPAPLTTTLTWNATGAESCRRGLIDVPLSGSVQITGIVVDTQHTVTCVGDNFAEVKWEAPTDMITGVDANGNCITAPIPATGPDALSGFRIVYNTSIAALQLPPPPVGCPLPSATQPVGTIINIPDVLARTYKVTNLTNGDYFFMIAAYNVAGQYSFFTGPAQKTVVPTSTSATVLIDVQAFSTYESPVYNVVKKTDGFVMVAVGTVPLNTPCIKTQTVNGYYAVPSSQVTWSGSVRSIVVVAKCKDQ